jgi:hypothetical protein
LSNKSTSRRHSIKHNNEIFEQAESRGFLEGEEIFDKRESFESLIESLKELFILILILDKNTSNLILLMFEKLL